METFEKAGTKTSPSNAGPCMTAREVMDYLKISKSRLYRMTQARKLRVHAYAGRNPRFLRETIERLGREGWD